MMEASAGSFVYEIDAEDSDDAFRQLVDLFEDLSGRIVDANQDVTDGEMIEFSGWANLNLLAMSEAISGLEDEQKAIVYYIVKEMVDRAAEFAVLTNDERERIKTVLQRRSVDQAARMRAAKKAKTADRTSIIKAVIERGGEPKGMVAALEKQGIKIDVSNVYKWQKKAILE